MHTRAYVPFRSPRGIWVVGLFVVFAAAAFSPAQPPGASADQRTVSLGVTQALTSDQRRQEGFDPLQSAGLFIGVRNFNKDDQLVEVPFAVDDAVDLAHLLVFHLELLDSQRAVLCLSGEPQKPDSQTRLAVLKQRGARVVDAEQSTILRELEAQRKEVGPQGIYIVHAATHGFSDAGADYLVAQDSLRNFIKRTGILVNEVFDEIAKSRTPRRLVLLDACRERLTAHTRAGGVTPESAMGRAFAEAVAAAAGQIVLTGTVQGGYAYDDSTRKNGVFTAAVMEGLRGSAKPDERGFVTAESLANYVNDHVILWVRENRPDHSQISRGIEKRIESNAALLPLAVSPEAFENFKQWLQRRQNAVRSLKQQLDPSFINQDVIGEVTRALQDGERQKAEAVVRKIELLEEQKGYTPQDFALYWKNQGRQEFASVIFINQISNSPGSPPWFNYAVVGFLGLLSLFMAGILLVYLRGRLTPQPMGYDGVTRPAPAPAPPPRPEPVVKRAVAAPPAPKPAPAPAPAPPPKPTQPPTPKPVILPASAAAVPATAKVVEAPKATPSTPARVEKAPSPARPEAGFVQRVDLGGGVTMNLVYIRGGTFTMGSPSNESGRNSDEGPQTRVTLTEDFWMGETEVTQAQWKAVMGTNPSLFKGDNLPVENVSWNDAMEFCKKLTEHGSAGVSPATRGQDGRAPLRFTLPTEAQWEYACRAGTTTRYSFGDSDSSLGDYAWYDKNSGGKTQPVKTKKPNAWGLYDMHGNVFEWCLDWYADKLPGGSVTNPTGPGSGGSRVLRGGSWSLTPAWVRSALRDLHTPSYTDSLIGFRVVAVPRP